MVIPTTTYYEKVPVMVGSKIIDQANGSNNWRGSSWKWPWPEDRLILGLSCLGHYSCSTTSSKGTRVRRGGGPIPPQGLALWRWRSSAWTTSWAQFANYMEGYYSPFWYWSVYTAIPVSEDTVYRLHILAEATPGPQLPTSVVHWLRPMENYIQGSSWVPTCLQNLSTCSIEIPTKAVVGQVVPANLVPLVVLLVQKPQGGQPAPPKKDGSRRPWDLQGLGEWFEAEQEQARELLLKWEHLFACNNLELGKTHPN